ncbi:MAG: S8 family serine peptidase [Oceanipulchritudo sp.]
MQPGDLPYPVRIEEIINLQGEVVEKSKMVANRFILRISPEKVSQLETYAATRNIEIRKLSPIGLYRLETLEVTPDGVPLAIHEARNSALDISYAEPDYILHTMETPDDPAYANGSLWGLHNTGQDNGTVDADIDAPEAWGIRTSAADVVVAVIDTGVNYLHEDLKDNMWVNAGETGFDNLGRDKRTNQIDDDANGYIDDVHGINIFNDTGDPLDDNRHGSHCAGTIAGRGNNGVGTTGIAWEAQIMAIKYISASGSGASSDAIIGLQYAIDNGAHISNNSYGSFSPSEGFQELIRFAGESGHLFVVAAGNFSYDNDVRDVYPANYAAENIVSVAAFDRSGQIPFFSDYGSGSVEIAAPGVAIYSAGDGQTDSYETMNGTSMATPHVVGVAALLKAQFPDATPAALRNRLLKSAVQSPATEGTTISGGLLNAHAALLTTDNRPYNDDFANAHPVADDTETIRTSNSFASSETGEPNPFGTPLKSIWFAYTTPADGTVVVSTHGSEIETNIAVYEGTDINALTPVASSNDVDPAPRPVLSFQGTEDTTYYVSISGKNNQEGHIQVTLSGPPKMDLFNKAEVISGFPYGFQQDNSNASAEVGESAHAGNAATHSLWFKFNFNIGGKAWLRTLGSEIDTVMAVYTSNKAQPALTELIPVVSNDDAPYGQNWSEIALSIVAGRNYWVALDGKNGAKGIINLSGAFKPANDDFDDSIPITIVPYSTTIENRWIIAATRQQDEPSHGDPDALGTLWWTFIPEESGDYRIRLSGRAVFAAYTGSSLDALTLVASDKDPDDEFAELLLKNAVQGMSYHIAYALSPDNLERNHVLFIESYTPLENDNLVNAFEIPPDRNFTIESPFSHSYDSSLATTEPDEDLSGSGGGRTAWYRWSPSATATYVLTGNGSEASLLNLKIFKLTGSLEDGLQHSDLTFIKSDKYSGEEFLPWTTLYAERGETYFIQLSHGEYDPRVIGQVRFSTYRFIPPSNDHLRHALEVEGLFAQREYYNSGATREAGEPNHSSTNWYYNGMRPHEVHDGQGGDWLVGYDIEVVNSTIWFKWTPGPEHLGIRTAVSSMMSSRLTAVMVYEADSTVLYPTYADIQPVMALHPDPERVPQGPTTDPGYADTEDKHALWDTHPLYPDMYPPDPDYDESFPDNRNPYWRPGSSFCYMRNLFFGEVHFIPEEGKTYYIMMGGWEPNKFALMRLSIWQNPNDNLADAEVLTGTDIEVDTANFAATWETGEPFHYVDSSGNYNTSRRPGGRSVWYKWTCPEEGIYTFDTYHSYLGWNDFPVPVPPSSWKDSQNWGGTIQLSVYSSESANPTVGDLNRLDCQTIMSNNQNRNAKMALHLTAGTTYYIALDNHSLSLAWFLHDYEFDEHGPKSEWCNRAIMALNIHKGSLPNDDLANASVLPSEEVTQGVHQEFSDLAYAWNEPGEPAHGLKASSKVKSAWWKWTAPQSGTYWVGAAPDYYHHENADRKGSSGRGDIHAAVVAVYSGPESTPNMADLSLVMETNSETHRQNYTACAAPFEAVAGQTYFFALAVPQHYRSSSEGAYRTGFQFGPAPSNDHFASASLVEGYDLTVHGNNLGATEESGEPRIRPTWYMEGSKDSSVWWKWTALGTGQTTISTYGSYIVNELAIYTGNAVNSLNVVAFEMEGEHIDNKDTYEEMMDQATREVSFNAEAGVTYYIKVNGGGYGREAQGPITLSISGQKGVPKAPTNFNFARVNASRVNFTWTDNALDEDAYVIQSSRTTSGPWSEVFNTGIADVTSGSDLNATRGYHYRLRAENTVGSSDWVYLSTIVRGTVPTGYNQEWKDRAFPPGATGPDTDAAADYNDDGRANIADYAYQIITQDPFDSIGKLPELQLGQLGDDVFLEYTFRRILDGTGSPISPEGYLASEVRYTLQYNNDLGTNVWITGNDFFEIIGEPVLNEDGTESITVRLSVPINSDTDPQHLIRLLIEFVP